MALSRGLLARLALVGALGEADALDEALRALLRLPRGQLVEGAPVLEVLPPGQTPVEAALAAEDDADQRPDGLGLFHDVVPVHAGAARLSAAAPSRGS